LRASASPNRLREIFPSQAIALILQDRLEDGLRGLPEEAEQDVVTIE
jgi:hypothetical protein